MNTFRKAFVYIRDRYAGLLEETDDGCRFQYDAEYLQRIRTRFAYVAAGRQAIYF